MAIFLNDINIYVVIILLVNLSTIKSNLLNCKYDEDKKLMGDLYKKMGKSILSLTWSVELHNGCDIKEVLRSILRSSRNFFNNSFADCKCANSYIGKLYIAKRLEPMTNVFVLAHPFYRTYNKFKRKFRSLYQRKILNNNFLNSTEQNSLKDLSHTNSDAWTFFEITKCVNKFLKEQKCIRYAKQEVLRPRYKRSHIQFSDPLFKDQWHLNNGAKGGYDINVLGAWESGITGRGITVCVIDDGLEWKHPDLQDNYDPRGSYDLNADDADPSPVKNGGKNEHGTRCAGEIAAVTNSVCGVGVAYRANISGIRVLGEHMTDSMEAAAFVQGLHINDIYSCSWGPNDDGKTVDGPHHLAKKALFHGITYGRKGYGAIYVVASGNGGRNKDNCNFDGYANSIYTVTIGAVDSRGRMPYYAEECSTILGVTPSSGSNGRAIVTTDWMGSSASGCTSQHSGTSAAAPMAAAVIALALEMQPCLSWRDVQYLIALTSRMVDATSDWITNDAGLHHSHQHGFGLMDATGMVSAAAVWESVPFHAYFKSDLLIANKAITSMTYETLMVNHTLAADTLNSYGLFLLEFVQVYVTIEHECRGSLMINLTCPSGTTSILATPRINDNSTLGLQHWPLGTVRCWGEKPFGTYSLAIHHSYAATLKGQLVSWQLVLHGAPLSQAQFQQRRRMVNEAVMGKVVHVNRSELCHPPEINFKPFFIIPEKWMKILGIIGCFLTFMLVYSIMEYVFCYEEEKKKFQLKLKDLSQSLSLQNRRKQLATEHSLNIIDETESISLLDISGTSRVPGGAALYECSRVSPTLSCEADVSSLNEDTDVEEELSSSRNTDDTLIPRDTATDLTTDFTTDVPSEPDDDKRTREDAHKLFGDDT